MKSKFFRPFLAIASVLGGLFSKQQTSAPVDTGKRGKRLTGDRLRRLFEPSVFSQSGRPGNIAIRIAARQTNQRKRRQQTRRLIAAGAC